MRRPGGRMRLLVGRGVTIVCLAVIGVVVLLVILPALFGLQRYVITGASMTGSIPKGAVVYSRLTPTASLRQGDVITFVPPGMSQPVTHRIVAIRRDARGELVFRTKGDFNESADPWRMHLTDPVQARYSFHVPHLGYLLAALAVRPIRMLLIGVPAVIIALSLLVSLWREAGEELEGADGALAGAPAARLATEPATPFDHLSEAEQREYRGWWWDA